MMIGAGNRQGKPRHVAGWAATGPVTVGYRPVTVIRIQGWMQHW